MTISTRKANGVALSAQISCLPLRREGDRDLLAVVGEIFRSLLSSNALPQSLRASSLLRGSQEKASSRVVRGKGDAPYPRFFSFVYKLPISHKPVGAIHEWPVVRDLLRITVLFAKFLNRARDVVGAVPYDHVRFSPRCLCEWRCAKRDVSLIMERRTTP